MAAATQAADDTAAAAQAFGKARPAVLPQADGTIVCEAEEFQVASPGWQAKNWGDNYYAATLANCFLSRKAFLGAPEQCDEPSRASITVQVPQAGRYLALVRYEAAYRFETQFRLIVEQNGKTVLDRLYGARDNLKIWAFAEKLKKEVAWSWGAVENVVWEGHDAALNLEAGTAKLTLVAGKQPGDAAKRNVDLVLLTTDEAQVKERIEKDGYLPLDGMLTQSGDLYLKLHNQADGTQMTLTANPCTEHSPYWVHPRKWQPIPIEAAAGAATDWVEVGGLLDTLNDGQWALAATAKDGKSPLHYKLEFGLRGADGQIAPIFTTESRKPMVQLAFHADARYSRRLRLVENVLYDLLAYLKQVPLRGKRPEQTLILGYSFPPRPDDPQYAAAREEFLSMYNLSSAATDNPAALSAVRGAIDVRGVPTEQLAEYCQKLGEGAKKIASVSLGDEIGLGAPPADDHESFRTWLKSRGLKASDVLPAAGEDWSQVTYSSSPEAKAAQPGVYYWSKRYQHHFGVQELKKRTDILLQYMPQAGIGANFSPHHGGAKNSYLGEVHQWVNTFRAGGMTMPWSEDYIWQVPVGTPQMNFINLDLFRAGIRHKPEAKIQYYVMPHAPGNTPKMWRRQFYGDLAHGMKIVNLFEFHPVQVAYTENHVSNNAMFAEVRKSFYELGQFEDIIQAGRVRPGIAGLWFSETGDIWDDNAGSFAAGKRALYTAIRHAQIPLDFVVEDDALDGTLAQYKILYLTDNHVSRAASAKIVDWVKAGGRLFATAGGGMFDELNQPNKALRELIGVEQTALDGPEASQIGFIKQDLPFTTALDVVSGDADSPFQHNPLQVFGVRSRVQLSGTKALAHFKDGAPAVAYRELEKGDAFYFAFLPGLSYYQPAIPKRPVDRGSSDDAMSQFIPMKFHNFAGVAIASPADKLTLPVVSSERLVETTIIESPKGLLIPAVNWSGGPVKGLKLTVNVPVPTASAVLASGEPLEITRNGEITTFKFNLEEADALILR